MIINSSKHIWSNALEAEAFTEVYVVYTSD